MLLAQHASLLRRCYAARSASNRNLLGHLLESSAWLETCVQLFPFVFRSTAGPSDGHAGKICCLSGVEVSSPFLQHFQAAVYPISSESTGR